MKPFYSDLRLLRIASHPNVNGGAPSVRGIRLVDLLDRVDAGDAVGEVAEDFGIPQESLELLTEVRDSLKPDLLPGEQMITVSREAMLGFLGHGHPHSAAWFCELQRTFEEATDVRSAPLKDTPSPTQPAVREAP